MFTRKTIQEDREQTLPFAFISVRTQSRIPGLVKRPQWNSSDAICKYLADKTQSDLYLKGLNKERAVVDQWLSFCSTHIFIAAGKVLFYRVFAPILELSVDKGRNGSVRSIYRY
ncbi:MAG: hypothetical protein K8S27_06175 [Candidatus Omnitrophica bacterium]|nr:hypothetical protein [Candidatus Omnitrophota bacterium]